MFKETSGNKKKIHEENKRCIGPGCQNNSSYSKIVTVKDKFLMRIRTLDKQSKYFC